jgi:hypothetical protein
VIVNVITIGDWKSVSVCVDCEQKGVIWNVTKNWRFLAFASDKTDHHFIGYCAWNGGGKLPVFLGFI